MRSTFWSSGSGWGARDSTFLASYQNMPMCFSHTPNSKGLACTSSSWPLQAERCQGRMSSKIWLDTWGDWMEFKLRSLGLSASHYSEGKPTQMLTHAVWENDRQCGKWQVMRERETQDKWRGWRKWQMMRERGNARQVKGVKKMTDDAEEGNARQVKGVKKKRWNTKRWLTDMYVAGCYQSMVQTARDAAAESSPRGRKS